MAGYPQPVPRRGASLLASDEERDRAARALRRHYAAGRIDEDDLESRLDVVVSARTRGELAVLFRDLPSSRGSRVARLNRQLLRAHGGGYLTVNGTLVGISELTGGGPFWPAWALVPTTGLLAWHVGGTWVARRMASERRGRSFS